MVDQAGQRTSIYQRSQFAGLTPEIGGSGGTQCILFQMLPGKKPRLNKNYNPLFYNSFIKDMEDAANMKKNKNKTGTVRFTAIK